MKYTLTLIVCTILAIPLSAKTVDQTQLNFPVKTLELMSGDIHTFSSLLSPKEAVKKYPEVFEMDSLALLQNPNATITISKKVMVVDKPAGFFDDKQLSEESFVAHIFRPLKTRKTSPDTYAISNSSNNLLYRWQVFFDADDVSTLPNSKVPKAVATVKKLDVISQGASIIMVTESSRLTKAAEGTVAVSSFIPLKENKTLIITYEISSLLKASANIDSVRKETNQSAETYKSAINNF